MDTVSPPTTAGFLSPLQGPRATDPENSRPGSPARSPAAPVPAVRERLGAPSGRNFPPSPRTSSHSYPPGLRCRSNLRKPSEETHPLPPGIRPKHLQRGPPERPPPEEPAGLRTQPPGGAFFTPFTPSGEENYLKKIRRKQISFYHRF